MGTYSLRRITRDGRWIPEIDGLRFIAIAAVLLYHLATELSGRLGPVPFDSEFLLVRNGFRGVQLFFAISGLVLALPFARQHLAQGKTVILRTYYFRRLTRIEPPYLVALAGSMIVYGLYSHAWHDALIHAAASLVYLHDLLFGTPSKVNGVFWSLEVEVQFYLIAPLLMQVYRLQSFASRLACYGMLAAASDAAELLFHTPRVDLSLPSSLIFFVAGMLAADLYITQRHLFVRSADAAGIAALAALFCLTGPQFFWMGPLCTLILCLAALQGSWLRRALSLQGIATVGGMCYSIYLWHLKLMELCLLFTHHCLFPQWSYAENYLLQIALVILPVVAFSTIFYILIERPCMDASWPSKLRLKLKGHRPEKRLLDSGGLQKITGRS